MKILGLIEFLVGSLVLVFGYFFGVANIERLFHPIGLTIVISGILCLILGVRLFLFKTGKTTAVISLIPLLGALVMIYILTQFIYAFI